MLYFQLNLNPIGDEGMEGLIKMIKLQPTLTYVSLEVKLQCNHHCTTYIFSMYFQKGNMCFYQIILNYLKMGNIIL